MADPDIRMQSPNPIPPGRRPGDHPPHLDWKLLPRGHLELSRKILSDVPLFLNTVGPRYWSVSVFYQWLHTYSYSTLARESFTPETFFAAWTGALLILSSFPPYGTHPADIAQVHYLEMKHQRGCIHHLREIQNSPYKVGWYVVPMESLAPPDKFTATHYRVPGRGRFQKLAQSRGGGITIVNQPTSLESRPGRSLGLGQGTGSRPTGNSQRITTGGNGAAGGSGRSRGSGGVQGSAAGGLHTAAGLARAMQERGSGVSDQFLFAPAAFVAGSGGGPSARGGRNARGGGVLRGAGGARQQQQQGQSNNRVANHKALALGQRPGRKQVGQVPQTQQQQAQGGRGRNGRGANNGAQAQAQGQGRKGKGAQTTKSNGPGGKQGKKGKANTNAGSLDTELDEYMMKDRQTAASALDNDLDSYMAEKPEETTW
ncbi:hypothetical protein BG003_000026 [Podila horticola]|nr:hypothetical protein BG003_000026 [Podila horticola]